MANTVDEEINFLLENNTLDAVYYALKNNPTIKSTQNIIQKLESKFKDHTKLVKLARTLNIFSERFISTSTGDFHMLQRSFKFGDYPLYFYYELNYAPHDISNRIQIELSVNDNLLIELQLPFYDYTLEQDDQFAHWHLLLTQLGINDLPLNLILSFFSEILTPPLFEATCSSIDKFEIITICSALHLISDNYCDFSLNAEIAHKDKRRLHDIIGEQSAGEKQSKNSIAPSCDYMDYIEKNITLANQAAQLINQYPDFFDKTKLKIYSQIMGKLKNKIYGEYTGDNYIPIRKFIENLTIIDLQVECPAFNKNLLDISTPGIYFSLVDESSSCNSNLWDRCPNEDFVVSVEFKRSITFASSNKENFTFEYAVVGEDLSPFTRYSDSEEDEELNIRYFHLDSSTYQNINNTLTKLLSPIDIGKEQSEITADIIAQLCTPIGKKDQEFFDKIEKILKKYIIKNFASSHDLSDENHYKDTLSNIIADETLFKDLPLEFINNEAFILKTIQGIHTQSNEVPSWRKLDDILEYCSKEILDNEKIISTAIKLDPHSLSYASNRIKNNPSIVTIAIKKDYRALDFISRKLRDSESIISAAITNKYNCSAYAIEYASQRLKDNKAIVLRAVAIHGEILEHCSERLRNDKEVVLAAVNHWGCSLEYASPILRDNEEIVRAAIKQDIKAIAYASDRLKWSDSFLKKIGVDTAE